MENWKNSNGILIPLEKCGKLGQEKDGKKAPIFFISNVIFFPILQKKITT